MEHRYPKQTVKAHTFEADAARRDFTINSIGIDARGLIYDYFGGIKDLENKILRTTGDAKQRFTEDALRIYRLLRFGAELGFKIHADTLQAAKELIGLTSHTAIERVTAELYKSAGTGKSLAAYIEALDDVGLLEKTLPEVKSLQGKVHNPEHHPEGDAYQHTLAAVRMSRSHNPIINLAVLFHDVGKGTTYKNRGTDTSPKHTYYGHDFAGINLINDIARRIKLSDEDKQTLQFAAARHMLMHDPSKLNKSTIASLVNDKNWEALKETAYADEMSRPAPYSSEERVLGHIQQMEEVAQKLSAGAGAEGLKKRTKQLVDGVKILEWFPELKQPESKPFIGKVITAVHQWIVNAEKFSATEVEVKTYAAHVLEQLK